MRTIAKILLSLVEIVIAAARSLATWALPTIFVVALLFLVGKFTGGIDMPGFLRPLTDRIGWSTPKKLEKPRKERVADNKDKYRAYTLLADFAGASLRLRTDMVKVLCTLINLENTGVDPKDIFTLQMELVPPGWGRRKTETYNPFLGRNFYVPNRYLTYIEKTFPEDERDLAIELAKEVKDNMTLCPPGWNAITLIRPDRSNTVGNQRPDELAAIRDGKTLVPQEVDPNQPTEFEFYRKR